MIINVINLPHRTDRLNAILYQTECLAPGSIVVHQAVNGQKEFFEAAVTKRMRGHYGCLQSHRNLLKKVEKETPYHIVFEDDVVLCEDFDKKIQEVLDNLPGDWAIIYLGGNIVSDGGKTPYNEMFSRAKEVYATHAYIVNNDYVGRLQFKLNERLGKVDVLFIEFQKEWSCFIVNDIIATQSDSKSDIDFKPVEEV